MHRDHGKQILNVENLSYKNEAGVYLFKDVTFTLMPGEKMVVLSNDDIAKTKLLEIISGVTKPTEGTVTWGQTIKHTYFPNENSNYFKGDETILEWISKWPLENSTEETKDASDARMRSFLGRMLFSSDSVFKKVNVTSGGEKARLMFSRMMLLESNFLIFDQPLDHLDTESIDSVIEGIQAYKGGVVFTTYNRAFVNKCANVIFEMKPNFESFIFRGSLQDYEETMGY